MDCQVCGEELREGEGVTATIDGVINNDGVEPILSNQAWNVCCMECTEKVDIAIEQID